MKKSRKRKTLPEKLKKDLTITQDELKESTKRLRRLKEYRRLPYKSRKLIGLGTFVYQKECAESKILDRMKSDNANLDTIILWEKLSIRRLKERVKEIKNQDSEASRYYNPRRRSSTYEAEAREITKK